MNISQSYSAYPQGRYGLIETYAFGKYTIILIERTCTMDGF